MSYRDTSRKKDVIDRTNKGKNYVGTATFVGGRLLAPCLIYGFLRHDWGRPLIGALGGSTLPQGPPVITGTFLDQLGLSPYRSIILAMSAGAALKQSYHVAVIAQEQITPAVGVKVSIGNFIMDLANTLFFVCAQTSASVNGQHFPQTPLVVGSTIYAAGLLLEWASEQQRHRFKQDPANKGRLYTGGLFRLSRHVNFFGFTLWRVGFSIAAGGWTWGATWAAIITSQFLRKSIPPLQHYLEERYGEQFEEYKKTTPYKFIPLVL